MCGIVGMSSAEPVRECRWLYYATDDSIWRTFEQGRQAVAGPLRMLFVLSMTAARSAGTNPQPDSLKSKRSA